MSSSNDQDNPIQPTDQTRNNTYSDQNGHVNMHQGHNTHQNVRYSSRPQHVSQPRNYPHYAEQERNRDYHSSLHSRFGNNRYPLNKNQSQQPSYRAPNEQENRRSQHSNNDHPQIGNFNTRDYRDYSSFHPSHGPQQNNDRKWQDRFPPRERYREHKKPLVRRILNNVQEYPNPTDAQSPPAVDVQPSVSEQTQTRLESTDDPTAESKSGDHQAAQANESGQHNHPNRRQYPDNGDGRFGRPYPPPHMKDKPYQSGPHQGERSRERQYNGPSNHDRHRHTFQHPHGSGMGAPPPPPPPPSRPHEDDAMFQYEGHHRPYHKNTHFRPLPNHYQHGQSGAHAGGGSYNAPLLPTSFPPRFPQPRDHQHQQYGNQPPQQAPFPSHAEMRSGDFRHMPPPPPPPLPLSQEGSNLIQTQDNKSTHSSPGPTGPTAGSPTPTLHTTPSTHEYGLHQQTQPLKTLPGSGASFYDASSLTPLQKTVAASNQSTALLSLGIPLDDPTRRRDRFAFLTHLFNDSVRYNDPSASRISDYTEAVAQPPPSTDSANSFSFLLSNLLGQGTFSEVYGIKKFVHDHPPNQTYILSSSSSSIPTSETNTGSGANDAEDESDPQISRSSPHAYLLSLLKTISPHEDSLGLTISHPHHPHDMRQHPANHGLYALKVQKDERVKSLNSNKTTPQREVAPIPPQTAAASPPQQHATHLLLTSPPPMADFLTKEYDILQLLKHTGVVPRVVTTSTSFLEWVSPSYDNPNPTTMSRPPPTTTAAFIAMTLAGVDLGLYRKLFVSSLPPPMGQQWNGSVPILLSIALHSHLIDHFYAFLSRQLEIINVKDGAAEMEDSSSTMDDDMKSACFQTFTRYIHIINRWFLLLHMFTIHSSPSSGSQINNPKMVSPLLQERLRHEIIELSQAIQQIEDEMAAEHRICIQNQVDIATIASSPITSTSLGPHLLLACLFHQFIVAHRRHTNIYTRMPLYYCASIGLEMFRVLWRVHSCGVIHRDVKFGNFAFTIYSSAPGTVSTSTPPQASHGINNIRDNILVFDFGAASVYVPNCPIQGQEQPSATASQDMPSEPLARATIPFPTQEQLNQPHHKTRGTPAYSSPRLLACPYSKFLLSLKAEHDGSTLPTDVQDRLTQHSIWLRCYASKSPEYSRDFHTYLDPCLHPFFFAQQSILLKQYLHSTAPNSTNSTTHNDSNPLNMLTTPLLSYVDDLWALVFSITDALWGITPWKLTPQQAARFCRGPNRTKDQVHPSPSTQHESHQQPISSLPEGFEGVIFNAPHPGVGPSQNLREQCCGPSSRMTYDGLGHQPLHTFPAFQSAASHRRVKDYFRRGNRTSKLLFVNDAIAEGIARFLESLHPSSTTDLEALFPGCFPFAAGLSTTADTTPSPTQPTRPSNPPPQLSCGFNSQLLIEEASYHPSTLPTPLLNIIITLALLDHMIPWVALLPGVSCDQLSTSLRDVYRYIEEQLMSLQRYALPWALYIDNFVSPTTITHGGAANQPLVSSTSRHPFFTRDVHSPSDSPAQPILDSLSSVLTAFSTLSPPLDLPQFR